MKQKVKNNGSEAGRLFNRLVAEKKRAVMALCLVAVMVFMWVRVLTKKSPEAADAALVTGQANADGETEVDVNVSYVELPKIAGRSDVITRDFFASNGWRAFVNAQGQNSESGGEVRIVSKGGSEELIRAIAGSLKLEAIGLGISPHALINNEMLSVGDKVLIRDVVDVYECEVIEIREDAVVIRCQEAEITLKLTQVIENSK
jgi:hypothetical protein